MGLRELKEWMWILWQREMLKRWVQALLVFVGIGWIHPHHGVILNSLLIIIESLDVIYG